MKKVHLKTEENHQKVAVHALIKKGDRYLITHRSFLNDWKPDEWDIPGGSIEFGELNPKKALEREMQEETGLQIKVGKLLHLYSSMSSAKRHQFQFVYECNYLQGDIVLNPEEHDEFRWVKVEELKSLQTIAFLKSLYEEILTKLNFE